MESWQLFCASYDKRTVTGITKFVSLYAISLVVSLQNELAAMIIIIIISMAGSRKVDGTPPVFG